MGFHNWTLYIQTGCTQNLYPWKEVRNSMSLMMPEFGSVAIMDYKLAPLDSRVEEKDLSEAP